MNLAKHSHADKLCPFVKEIIFFRNILFQFVITEKKNWSGIMSGQLQFFEIKLFWQSLLTTRGLSCFV